MRVSVTRCLSLGFFAASLCSAAQVPSNPQENSKPSPTGQSSRCRQRRNKSTACLQVKRKRPRPSPNTSDHRNLYPGDAVRQDLRDGAKDRLLFPGASRFPIPPESSFVALQRKERQLDVDL